MTNYVIGGIEGVNPFLVVRGPNGLKKPKPTHHVSPVQPVHPLYDNHGRLPHYQERPSNYIPLDLYV